MLIDIIAGARPNFMKIAPIIDAIQSRQQQGSPLVFRLIHTGQHYDKKMSGNFFDQLGIPKPDVNLEVGSGTQAEQTAAIMMRYEALLSTKSGDLCLVVGDVTSTMACAIVAKKAGVNVAHIEAGIRSGDWAMPEEINRIVTDAITDYFFTTSIAANQNLKDAGVSDERIFFVGNTMIDTLKKNLDRLVRPSIWDTIGLEENNYFVITLHRPSNVDEENTLTNLISEIIANAQNLPIVFPVHPRTAKIMTKLGIQADNFHMIDPLGYLEFIYLVKNAKAVITDSGGITEETTVLGIPCMTLRDSTERPETCELGTNELLGTNPKAIKPALDKLFDGQWKEGRIPELWDGETAIRIVSVLEEFNK